MRTVIAKTAAATTAAKTVLSNIASTVIQNLTTNPITDIINKFKNAKTNLEKKNHDFYNSNIISLTSVIKNLSEIYNKYNEDTSNDLIDFIVSELNKTPANKEIFETTPYVVDLEFGYEADDTSSHKEDMDNKDKLKYFLSIINPLYISLLQSTTRDHKYKRIIATAEKTISDEEFDILYYSDNPKKNKNFVVINKTGHFLKCKVDILSGTTKLESWLCICIPRWQVANPDDHSGAFIKGLGFLHLWRFANK
jgi:hypothetical protein